MEGTYDLPLVALSIAVAVLASYTALDLSRRVTATRGRAAFLWLGGGAVAMGTGIWSMHFIGMLAFELPISMGYDVGITALSAVIAVLVAGFALWTASRERLTQTRLLFGGLLMGTGIVCMHYSGMYAMRMFPPIRYDPLLFAVSVGIAVIASVAALFIAFKLRHGRSAVAAATRVAASLVMGAAIVGMHYTGMAAAQFSPTSICLAATLVSNDWLALTVGLLTFGILTGTLLVSVIDARLAERNGALTGLLQRANDELRQVALHDHLTGLPNRLLLEDRIAAAVKRGELFAVLFADIDHFKTVNESQGHLAGDELLRTLAGRLRSTLGEHDTAARVGGDQFVVVLGGCADRDDIERAARRLLGCLTAACSVLGHELRMSASIGIGVYPDDGTSAHQLLVNADAAMHRVKRNGRNDVCFYAEGMNSTAKERLALQNDLRAALERGELELYYQPQLSVRSGAIVGVEALARWRHARRGMVPPMEFIGIAEDCGLIRPLGAWVLNTACAQARRWRDAGLPDLRMAVNLSAAQFQQPDLFEVITEALTAADLDPRWLELEVTESVVMQNAEEAARTLGRLRAMGVQLAVDDFGTGYSSLGQLKRFPVGTLKIDRSFVRDLASDTHDAAIVRAVVALAHSLGLNVVAEGVETPEQLAYLEGLRADEYQGYLCSPPLPAADLEALVRERAEPVVVQTRDAVAAPARRARG